MSAEKGVFDEWLEKFVDEPQIVMNIKDDDGWLDDICREDFLPVPQEKKSRLKESEAVVGKNNNNEKPPDLEVMFVKSRPAQPPLAMILNFGIVLLRLTEKGWECLIARSTRGGYEGFPNERRLSHETALQTARWAAENAGFLPSDYRILGPLVTPHVASTATTTDLITSGYFVALPNNDNINNNNQKSIRWQPHKFALVHWKSCLSTMPSLSTENAHILSRAIDIARKSF